MIPTSKEKYPQIAPGVYKGRMSSNMVKILFEEGPKNYTMIEMNIGVKCMDCRCTVHVGEDGTVTATLWT